MNQSQSDKERFCGHYTVKREHALTGKNYGNHVVFQVWLHFLLFFVLFHKTVVSTHKTVDNKAPDQILPYFVFLKSVLSVRFSEIRQQIRVTRELLNQTALKTILLKKQNNITHAVLEFCTGRLVQSAPWEPTLRNNLNKGMN